jgi:hypothetical protein
MPMSAFLDTTPTLEDRWRAVILFGRNVACYKFALGQCLLALGRAGKTSVLLADLGLPFATRICEHLRHCDKQGTPRASRFLQACRDFNAGLLKPEGLAEAAARLGFNNVIDAFHVVNQGEVGARFFTDDRKGGAPRITLTDELFRMLEGYQERNLDHEVAARWHLVETAWDLGVAARSLVVEFDPAHERLFALDRALARRSITSCRDALNGYQKGKCFYCFADVSVRPGAADLADIDHFFPHALQAQEPRINLDGVWNLVLACQGCNRGSDGKFSRLPALPYLERLERRNTFLIESHHPLRETLLLQTGDTRGGRRAFLQGLFTRSKRLLIHTWRAGHEHQPAF